MADMASCSDVVIIFQSLPEEKGLGAEGVDFLLVLSAFEANIQVFFVGDGCQNIMHSSNSLPRYTKRFKALNDFGVNSIYVVDRPEREFVIPIETISEQMYLTLIKTHQRILRF